MRREGERDNDVATMRSGDNDVIMEQLVIVGMILHTIFLVGGSEQIRLRRNRQQQVPLYHVKFAKYFV